jgi:hypothetical protein
MLFLTIGKAKPGFTYEERVARRMEYLYPEGVKVLAEYWTPMSDPAVIVITEAETVTPIFQSLRVWEPYFDFTIVPAMTAEDGLKLAHEALTVTTA